MLPNQVLVEMPRGEALIPRPIQMLDLLAPVHRHPPARRLADPAIPQAGLAYFFIASAPTAEGPLADAQ
jgi:hypothetical protein